MIQILIQRFCSKVEPNVTPCDSARIPSPCSSICKPTRAGIEAATKSFPFGTPVDRRMAPKQNRILECLLGDRRWAVPCVAPPEASGERERVFLLRLPEPCIVTDIVLDTRLPCSIVDADVCCPQLDESQGIFVNVCADHDAARLLQRVVFTLVCRVE